MSASFAIGIDIGGSHMAMGLVDEGGMISSPHSFPLHGYHLQDILNLIGAEVKRYQASSSIVGLGVGLPGIVDAESGILYKAPHFPDWPVFPFRQTLSDMLKMEVVIDNEVNYFALGEYAFGAARSYRHAVTLTLGTGIGGALLIDGNVFPGDCGFAGEVGHMTIEANGARCICGNIGCWELYAASRAFEHHCKKLSLDDRQALETVMKSQHRTLEPSDIAQLAFEGFHPAQRLWELFGHALAMGINNLMNVLGIRTFVIGGKMVLAWDLFMTAVDEELERRAYAKNAAEVVITKAMLGDHGAMIGAAYHLWRQRRKSL